MPGQDQNSRVSKRQRGGRCGRRVLAIITVSLVVASGCGFSDGASRAAAPVEIIEGKDSAEAIIELEKRGVDLTAARVIDLVLGTAEADVSSTGNGGVEFTMHFPAGATITYVGQRAEDGARDDITVSGTWLQHPSGVFGADSGTWGAPSLAGDG